MKCPKCGYLGFESGDRCRNCGYDFSLTPAVAVPELPIRGDPAPVNPLDDLSLIDAASDAAAPLSDIGPDLDRTFGTPSRPDRTQATGSRRSTGELPLFGPSIADDEPLITMSSPPRAPLAVRRPTAELPRPRPGAGNDDRLRMQALELDVDPAAEAFAPTGRAERASRSTAPAVTDRLESAPVGQRLVAAAIDVLILAAVDAIVVYFTMQICGIPVDDLGILPKGPLLAFLLVQNGGYLVAFTAGGQTLGKMATGIRVVAADREGSLDLGRALIRTLIWFALAVPAGLGFLTLFSSDHRGLHDRFAGTRVIRVSA